MKTIFAPNPIRGPRPWVFLAGSIEQGEADHWQKRVTLSLSDLKGSILNPRRPFWDPTWENSASNPHFRQQVEWELFGQEQSDCILMHFDPKTKSPVTLLELGLFAEKNLIMVSCPKGYWRKGNVEIVCEQNLIEVHEDLDSLIYSFRDWEETAFGKG